MTRRIAVNRSIYFVIAASLLGTALPSAPAQAAEAQTSGQTAADTAPAPAADEIGRFALPVGAVGFGWG